jgi:hypothetical protein
MANEDLEQRLNEANENVDNALKEYHERHDDLLRTSMGVVGKALFNRRL